jgi:hypothetical protein
MSDGRTRALRPRGRLATGHASSAWRKTAGPHETALRGELAAYGQCHRILACPGKAAVHDPHKALRGRPATRAAMGGNRRRSLGRQENQPGAFHRRKRLALTRRAIQAGPKSQRFGLPTSLLGTIQEAASRHARRPGPVPLVLGLPTTGKALRAPAATGAGNSGAWIHLEERRSELNEPLHHLLQLRRVTSESHKSRWSRGRLFPSGRRYGRSAGDTSQMAVPGQCTINHFTTSDHTTHRVTTFCQPGVIVIAN